MGEINIMKYVNVIGAGLAGCEAAWQLAKRGISVKLYEMKPGKKTPAHHSNDFAELVCSNSLRSDQLTNAVGLLKEEMRYLDSLIIKCADETRVPAGGALAVDREGFSLNITQKLKNHPNIIVINNEVTELPEGEINIVATGPLTSDRFSKYLQGILGKEYLYFHDAAAPIVTLESINMEKAYKASRYDKGDADYINCPMEKDQYETFWNELVKAEVVELKGFEKEKVFEGCMPVETMAKRGFETLCFGPLKPVGLKNPNTGKDPYAVVQLRQDNKEGTLYNIVGFQTHLKWGEQKRVFGLIPGLENAEFVRYGVMHRNTYINSPGLLDETYRYNENIYFAGQMTGVEGYVESASSGLVAGLNAAKQFLNEENIIFPQETAIGALAHYVSKGNVSNFQPMNVNFGIMKTEGIKVRDKRQRYLEVSRIAIEKIKEIN